MKRDRVVPTAELRQKRDCMMFEWKDILTPLTTLGAVWLAARFTLRNEFRKKELEIRAGQLETLSEKCALSLLSMSNYAGYISYLIDINLNDIQLETPNISHIPSEKYGLWYEEAIESKWLYDEDLLNWCSHSLRFHRPSDFEKWRDEVEVTRDRICAFFLISRPGQEWKLRLGKPKTLNELDDFSIELKQSCTSMKKLRNHLVENIAEDYRKLLRSEPNNLWQLLSHWRKSMFSFFRRPSSPKL